MYSTSISPYPKTSYDNIETNTIRDIAANVNFRIEIPYPEYYIEYWETVNITVEITELKNQAWNNIVTELVWKDEGKLLLAEGENKAHSLGNIEPNETIKTNYTICASPKKLDNPIGIGYIYLYQDEVQQMVETSSWFEGEYSNWGELNYGLFGIEVQYPRLTIDGPLEVGGVIPVVELAFGENTTLTYNITNPSTVDLKNLTFQTLADDKLIEISTPYTTLETLSNNSFILYEISIRCLATEETETILYFNINTTIVGYVESSVRVEIVTEHLALDYDNRIVLYSWPIFIFSFAVLALIIVVFTIAKRAKTLRIERELEEKYGKSYLD